MPTDTPLQAPSRAHLQAQRGGALAVALHVVLLLAVLGQIVYLASRHRLRADMTSDARWSTTESTQLLLDRLEKRLVIQAYFSPTERLPVTVRATRSWADNFLDELVQLGKGKVVVQRFDPNSDTEIERRATRLGIKPLDLRSTSATSVSVDRHWQGLRLLYDGGKQKVIPQFAPGSSFVAEAMVTPAIKEVLTSQKRKFGYMEWPATAMGSQQPGGIGWNALRTLEAITKRYEFQNLKDEDGALLPADVDTLFLFRPKDLTDRQKYVFDQFVVRGGTLVVFADAAEYGIGPQRTFTRVPIQLDAVGSQQKLTDQLLHYGIDWRPKVLADMQQRAHTPLSPQYPQEYFALLVMTQFGTQQLVPVPYPYFFHAMAFDWKEAADELAKDATGKVDAGAAASYRQRFVAGMPADDFLFKSFKQFGRGPSFYWPTWVGLRERAGGVADLPADVTGRVLLWSSPWLLAEDPPQNLNPVGFGDIVQKDAELKKFNQRLSERLGSETRQQAPLMVEVKGTFASCFANRERPKRPSEIKEEEARKAAAEKDGEPKAGEQKPGEQKPGEKQPGAEAASEAHDVGPPPAQPDAEDTPKLPPEAPMLAKGNTPGRILMIGDSDFVRDDLVRGDHRQAGGPWSHLGPTFFTQLLDWLAEDSDLVALQSRGAVDRQLRFVATAATPNADPRQAEQALRAKTTWLRALNVLLPGSALAVLGLVLLLVRRAQKRSFLTSLN